MFTAASFLTTVTVTLLGTVTVAVTVTVMAATSHWKTLIDVTAPEVRRRGYLAASVASVTVTPPVRITVLILRAKPLRHLGTFPVPAEE